jgi:hypothetical protein
MSSLVEVRIGGRFRLNNILGKGLFSEVFEGKAELSRRERGERRAGGDKAGGREDPVPAGDLRGPGAEDAAGRA